MKSFAKEQPADGGDDEHKSRYQSLRDKKRLQESQFTSSKMHTSYNDAADNETDQETDQETMTSKGSSATKESSSVGLGWIKSSPSNSPYKHDHAISTSASLLDDSDRNNIQNSSLDEDDEEEYDVVGILTKAEEEFQTTLHSSMQKSPKREAAFVAKPGHNFQAKSELHNMFFNATETWLKANSSGLSSHSGSRGSVVSHSPPGDKHRRPFASHHDEALAIPERSQGNEKTLLRPADALGNTPIATTYGVSADPKAGMTASGASGTESPKISTMQQSQTQQLQISNKSYKEQIVMATGNDKSGGNPEEPSVMLPATPTRKSLELSKQSDAKEHNVTSPVSEVTNSSLNSSMESSSEESIPSEFLLSRYLEAKQQKKQKLSQSDDNHTTWETSARLSESSSSTSFMSMEGLTNVYVADKYYAWLPAKVLEYNGDCAFVSIVLPKSWDQSTFMKEEQLSHNSLKSADLHASMKGVPHEDVIRLCREYNLLRATLRKVQYKDYPQGELPLQNSSASNTTGSESSQSCKRDMAELRELHSSTILYNLKERHFSRLPYTRIGDIVVAMNPFQWIGELYEAKTRDLYAKTLIWQDASIKAEESKRHYDQLGFEPHVYEVSSLAYKGLAVDQKDQTILVTGESGAGKTETVKIVMNHLATVQETRPGGVDAAHSIARETVRRVCKSSPVFEAFGNATTVRNDNSSRFGRFIQLQFELESLASAAEGGRTVPYTDLVGSNTITYLLEKSRVVSLSEGERTYHIFYQLLAAPRQFKHELFPTFAARDVCDFSYLVASQRSAESDSDQDAELWKQTKDALETFQYQGESLKVLMRALAIVLQLGNIVFAKDVSTGDDNTATIISRDELELLSDLTGIDIQELEDTMTSRILKTGNEDIRVKLSPQVAKESCDALAKEIYARVFDSVVRRINETTVCPERLTGRTYGHISLLDIFGFERFEVNQFEQLCINFANEQLHHKYVCDCFDQVKDEYETEGIDVYDFKLVDNTEVLELLQGRHGLLTSLDEECLRPKGNAEAYVYKAKIVHENSDCLIDKKLHAKTQFGVRHFAGPVTYMADTFLQQNMDKLPDGLLESAGKSTNSLIRVEFKTLLSTRNGQDVSSGRKKRAHRTVLEKFRTQLKSLMSIMKNTRTRYIRCIKPNDSMIPLITDHIPTMRQLEYSGLMTAIAIARESFPNKLPYDFILDRYVYLMRDKDFHDMGTMELREKVQYILSKWLKPLSKRNRDGTRTMPFACGKTKVFFRAGAQDHLELLRRNFFDEKTVAIQSLVRQASAKKEALTRRKSIPIVQNFGRMALAIATYRRKRQASTRLSAWVRTRRAVASYRALIRQKSATLIQATYRAYQKSHEMHRLRDSTIVVQRATRNFLRKAAFAKKLVQLVEAAKMDTSLLELTEQVRSEQLEAPGMQTGVFKDVEDMFGYLRNEVVSLRAKCDFLRDKLVTTENAKRELVAQSENFEAAATSFQTRLDSLTKANDIMVREVFKYRGDLSKLRRSHHARNLEMTNKLTLAKQDLRRVSVLRDSETQILKDKLKQAQRVAVEEQKALRQQIAMMKEENGKEVRALREELHKAQDSHHAYLSKLMEVLEASQSMREQETERISAELEAVKVEKDFEISSLNKELKALRAEKNRSNQPSQTVQSVEDTAAMRVGLQKSLDSRARRTAQFDDAIQNLYAIVKDNAGSIGASNRFGGPPSQQINDMIATLDHLYKMEEDSQAKADQAKMDLIEQYVAVAKPDHSVREMQDRLMILEAEAAMLRNELRASDQCQRCGARR